MMKNYADKYGLALYNLSIEKECSNEIFNDLMSVSDIFKSNPEFMRLLSNPMLTASERAMSVKSVFGGKINQYLLNMLMILAEKRSLEMIEKCCLEFMRHYCKANNILAVTATAASPLSEEQKHRLISRLESKFGSKILLSCVVDPGCLGGIVLEYDGKRVDASVKQRFNSLRQTIKQSDIKPLI